MDRRQQWLRRIPMIAGALALILLVGGFVWFVRDMLGGKSDKPARTVQIVQVIRPPPPPPDEPPPPPPPEKVDEPIPQNEPEPTPDEASPSEQLGLDAEGTSGGDGFGLAARRGGSDLVGSGGAAFAWYTTMLKDEVLDRLSADNRIRSRKFSVIVKVWINPDGRVREAQLASSSGNRELDGAIELALNGLERLRESPPLEMPQPVSLKIVSRS
jgi:protein TonB